MPQTILPGARRFFAACGRDLRFGARRLRRAPAFTLVALLTLAFGMGAVGVVYTAADALVLGRLPYPHPERLMAIGGEQRRQPAAAGAWVSASAFADLRARARDFTALAALSPVWDVVAAPSPAAPSAERLQALYVSASLLPMLGAQPILGRGFTPDQDGGASPAPANVAVISNAYWRRRFAGRASVLGQPLMLDGAVFTVIGVLPPGFQYLGEPVAGTASQIDLWLPLGANPLITRPRAVRFLKLLGARRPGVSAAQARAEVQAIGEVLSRQYPADEAGLAYDAEPLADQVQGPHRPAMFLLLCAVGLVLLLACANLANLVLAQGLRRGPEIAVRRALGAGRGRLLCQLMTENLLLGALGGALGLWLADVGLGWLTRIAPVSLFNGHPLALQPRTWIVAGGVLLASVFLFGLAPAWSLLRARAEATVGARARGGAPLGRVRSSLVVVQMALALALLVGAGLLLRTFLHVMAVQPGFDVQRVVTLSTQLPPEAASATNAQRSVLDQSLLARLRAVPGVAAVAAASRLPLTGQSLTSTLWPEGGVYSAAGQPQVEYRVVSPGYFATMGVPLLAGRDFDLRDDTAPSAPSAVVVNRAAAQRYWPSESPVGRRLKLGPAPGRQAWITVVGVVGDVHSQGLDAAPEPTVFRPLAYSALNAPIVVASLAAGATPAAALDGLAGALRAFDPRMPVYNRFSMEQLLGQSVAQRRLLLMLLAIFAAAGIGLAALGVYASLAQNVAQRRRELGLRLALGATPGGLLRMVMAQGLRLTAVGIAVGAALAAILAASMAAATRSLLFQRSPFDAPVFALAALGLAAVGALAALLPAWRATQTPPRTTLGTTDL